MNKTIGSIMMILLSVSELALAQIPGTQTGLPSAHNSQECKSPDRAAWMPKANNVKALWHMDGTAGTIANGASIASGFSGGPAAAATISGNTLSYATSTIANFRQAITATGATATDTISLTNSATDVSAGTWSFWVKMAIPSSGQQRLFYKSDNNSGAGYLAAIYSDGTLEFVKVKSSSNMKLQTCKLNSTYFANTWRHIVITWDGTTTYTADNVTNQTGVKMYIDGVELTNPGAADTTRFTGTCSNTGNYGGYAYAQPGSGTAGADTGLPLFLMGINASYTSPTATAFTGSMDEFMIWNVALSAAEVAAVYKHQKCN
ncbi:LamG domain-containing protein [Bdellovibrio sp. SKB1291214]|uniref:LamG domain-containing protein n=1 Tax=Bdellovibrio sp. SKB1291214 TaxID=1732569 RepID=UPI000B51E571|nr:LamG domain-containing protein [Bdellovibrio sp. SKB1291214]UYL09086.1 LamG domain-containing protein [Bdellovibrio sp. SKB1291214]